MSQTEATTLARSRHPLRLIEFAPFGGGDCQVSNTSMTSLCRATMPLAFHAQVRRQGLQTTSESFQHLLTCMISVRCTPQSSLPRSNLHLCSRNRKQSACGATVTEPKICMEILQADALFNKPLTPSHRTSHQTNRKPPKINSNSSGSNTLAPATSRRPRDPDLIYLFLDFQTLCYISFTYDTERKPCLPENIPPRMWKLVLLEGTWSPSEGNMTCM